MAIIAYARVSTADQNISTQIERLKEAGAEVIFEEKKSGKSTDEREELERAIHYLRAGDVFLVTKLDRMARSLADIVRLVPVIEAKGAHFRCLDQAIDTTGPTGRLMLHVLAAFAQFELDIRRERQMEGIAAAKARGVYKPSRHETAPGKLSHASRMLKGGMNYVQTAERTGVSVDTLQRRFPQYKDQRAVAREARKREAGDTSSLAEVVARAREVVEAMEPAPLAPPDRPAFNPVVGPPARMLPYAASDGEFQRLSSLPPFEYGPSTPDAPPAPKRGLLGMFKR